MDREEGDDAMTKPDEALIWARENAAAHCDQDREPRIAAAYRQGQYDDDHLKADAEAYRAGQAASAERIKALEEAIRRLTNMLAESDDPPGLIMVVTKDLLDARALLKEADQ